jgi:hypothetical protein
MFEKVGFNRGVHVRGTPLWFDAERRRPLCVLTGLAARLPPGHARVVASADIATALNRAGWAGRVLPAPWERWTGLGGRQVRLQRAQPDSGSAVVSVSSGRERIVVAGLLHAAPIRWPRADLLVALAPTLGHRGASIAQVTRGLGMFIDQAEREGAPARVLVDSLEVGLMLATALTAGGRTPRILGVLGKLAAGEIVGSSHLTLALTGGRPSRARVAWVDSGLGPFGAGPPRGAVASTFRLRWYADWKALKQAVKESRAPRVALAGLSRAEEAAAGRRLGVEVVRLGRARQLSLSPAV